MIRLENVSKYYNDGNKISIGISNINLRFNEKGLILIKGESDSHERTCHQRWQLFPEVSAAQP